MLGAHKHALKAARRLEEQLIIMSRAVTPQTDMRLLRELCSEINQRVHEYGAYLNVLVTD
jgi:hypothetical protein